jgi:hypothetical protein
MNISFSGILLHWGSLLEYSWPSKMDKFIHGNLTTISQVLILHVYCQINNMSEIYGRGQI